MKIKQRLHIAVYNWLPVFSVIQLAVGFVLAMLLGVRHHSVLEFFGLATCSFLLFAALVLIWIKVQRKQP
jgi:hypothetical protein